MHTVYTHYEIHIEKAHFSKASFVLKTLWKTLSTRLYDVQYMRSTFKTRS